MNAIPMRWLFVLAGLYDFVLGVGALLFFRDVYAHYNITLPNHDGYVQWGAAVVAIFGLAFWMVAANPSRNRDIITLGILFKLAYAGVVLYHWFYGSIPSIWVPFAWADLGFAALFIWARMLVRRRAQT